MTNISAITQPIVSKTKLIRKIESELYIRIIKG